MLTPIKPRRRRIFSHRHMTRKAEVLIRRRQSQRKDVAFVLLQRYRYQEVDLEMTKLRLLNAYLTERLMVAVREILEVVEGTVSEYQEEAARTQRENENLRRRLREVGLDSEPDWSGSAHPLSLSASEGRSPIEQRCEQDWSSSFREDHELTGNEEEQDLCENQRPKQACDPAMLVSAGLHLPAYDPTGSLSTARFVKSDHEEGSIQPPDLFKIQIVSTEGAYSPPGVMADAIKMEPSEVYCGVSEKLAGPLSLDPVNPECNSKDGVASNRVGGGPLSLPEVEQPRGRSKKINGKRSHNCPQCGKAFSHVSRLKIHLRIHTGEKPFRCSQCGKCFNNDGTLKNHQRVHTEVRLYSCKECGMSFKDAYTCKKHQRVHTGEKPYCCTHCGKHFNEVGNLQTHIRTHTGERPYCCTLCGKRFAESGKLKKHFRIHTRGSTQS